MRVGDLDPPRVIFQELVRLVRVTVGVFVGGSAPVAAIRRTARLYHAESHSEYDNRRQAPTLRRTTSRRTTSLIMTAQPPESGIERTAAGSEASVTSPKRNSATHGAVSKAATREPIRDDVDLTFQSPPGRPCTS